MSVQSETVLSIAGWVAGDVRSGSGGEGSRPWASFRLAWTPRRFDRGKNEFVDTPSNFVTVFCGWQLARNVMSSVSKGDPVVVVGRLRVTERRLPNDSHVYRGVEVDAHAVGHNLAQGMSSFRKLTGRGLPGDEGGAPAPDGMRPDFVAAPAVEPDEEAA